MMKKQDDPLPLPLPHSQKKKCASDSIIQSFYSRSVIYQYLFLYPTTFRMRLVLTVSFFFFFFFLESPPPSYAYEDSREGSFKKEKNSRVSVLQSILPSVFLKESKLGSLTVCLGKMFRSLVVHPLGIDLRLELELYRKI